MNHETFMEVVSFLQQLLDLTLKSPNAENINGFSSL